MKSFIYSDYLKMLGSIEDDENYLDDSQLDLYISEPSERKKRKYMPMGGSTDVSNFNKKEISEAIYKYTVLKIGDLSIRINTYHGYSEKNKIALSLDISIWEDYYKTPSGAPCRMTKYINPKRDDRFNKCSWSNKFHNGKDGRELLVEEVVNIVKWVQAAHKISSFF